MNNKIVLIHLINVISNNKTSTAQNGSLVLCDSSVSSPVPSPMNPPDIAVKYLVLETSPVKFQSFVAGHNLKLSPFQHHRRTP